MRAPKLWSSASWVPLKASCTATTSTSMGQSTTPSSRSRSHPEATDSIACTKTDIVSAAVAWCAAVEPAPSADAPRRPTRPAAASRAAAASTRTAMRMT